MSRFRYLLPVIGVLILIPALMIGLTRDPSELPSTFLGKPAPEFNLPLLEDSSRFINSETIAGSKVLINVWATWCVGCRQEHNFLMELEASGQIPIYGINWRDDRAKALRWLEDLGDPYVATGYDGENRAGIDWGVYAAPETFLVDENGIVVHKHLGPLSWPIWERDFVPLL